MAYTPINTPAFLLAYSGAISGMANTGRITDNVAVDYLTITRIAANFAIAFDIAWNSPLPVNALEQVSIPLIVSQQFQGRGPGDPVANPALLTPQNWFVDAQAITALVRAGDNVLNFLNINPFAVPTPASTVLYTPSNPNNWANVPSEAKTALDILAQPNGGSQGNAAPLGPAATIQNATNTVTPLKSGIFWVQASFSAFADTFPATYTATLNVDGFPGTAVDLRVGQCTAAAPAIEPTLMAIVALDKTIPHTFGFQATVSVGNINLGTNRSKILVVELG
jgi:hypothetical protein